MKQQNIFLTFASLAALVLILKKLVSKKTNFGAQNITNDLPKNGSWDYRPLSGVTDITLHHTATGPDWPAGRIADLHIKERKWPGIAYHFLIYESGKVYQTNNLTSRTYHNGYNNTKAIGISMVGNYETSYPTEKQLQAVVSLCKQLKKEIPTITNLVGHKEYPGASTACPGGNTNLSLLRSKAGLSSYTKKASLVALADYYRYNANEADN